MARVHVQTYGCSLNLSDTEAIKGVLAEHGHELVAEAQNADVLLINSCTVKSPPEQRLFSQLRRRTKPVVVAGCVPQADPRNEHFKGVCTFGPKALSQAAFVVEEALAGRIVHVHEDVDEGRNELPTIPTHTHIGILPINAGCLSACAYCKTKHARGHLQSYPAEAIEKQFRALVNAGAKEIWLTSQDTATYGRDSGTDLVELLERLLQKQGDYRIRVGMANPQYLLPLLDRFVKVLQHPNMFRFVHLPVQSGSDKVLKDMRRGYNTEEFKTIVQRLRAAVPDVTIATDVIVGFPTETEEDYQQTEALLTALHIPVVNLSKFYSRPGTPAAKMKLLPTNIVKQRSTKLKKACEAIAKERNASYIGKEFSIIIDEEGKKLGTLIGRADNYVQAIVPKSVGEIGERITIMPESAGTFDVRA